MARPTIAEIRSQVDFQKTYFWELSFLRNPGFVAPNAYRLNLQCLSSELPTRENEGATLMIRGNQIFDPGISKVKGTLRLTFLETVDSQIRQFFYAWQEAVNTKAGNFNYLTADLRLTTSDNQENVNYEYWILWAYLESWEPGELTGGESEPLRPSITLKYTDYVEQPL